METPTEFKYFQHFPPEIQNMVFTEALCKPHVHFVRAGMEEFMNPPHTWSLKFYPVTKSKDTSGYRLVSQLSTVSLIAARAARLAATEKAHLPFAKTINGIDASTDIICVLFEKLRQWFSAPWARSNQFMPQDFDRERSIPRLRGIRKVAVVLSNHWTDRSWKRASAFRCFDESHIWCKKMICHEELMGFLDVFSDLETAYVILRPGGQPYCKEQAEEYKEIFFEFSPAERRAKGLEMFHDSKYSYVEVMRDVVNLNTPDTRYVRGGKVYKPMYLRSSDIVFRMFKNLAVLFTGPEAESGHPRFTMTQEQRDRVKFKLLLEVEKV